MTVPEQQPQSCGHCDSPLDARHHMTCERWSCNLERDQLRAEVEVMRSVVEAAEGWYDGKGGSSLWLVVLADAVDAYREATRG